MNTPNPLVPQGTFPDNRGRSHIRIAVFTILAVHIVLLGALLMAGCKKTAETDTADKGNSNNYPPVVVPEVTNPPAVVISNPPAVVASNPPSITAILPPPDLTPPSAGTDHVVVKGDSFYTLSKKYNVTMRAITDANPGVDSSKLKIGQKLKIPAASVASATSLAHAPAGDGKGNGAEQTYTVKSGDNLMKIAKAYSVSLKSLRSVNALKTDQIKVGQKLKIPSKTAPEPASAGTVLAPATLTATNPTP
jgi:LysM repeat protein